MRNKGLLDLPPELLEQIFCAVHDDERAHLASVCRVNKHLYTIARPLLFRTYRQDGSERELSYLRALAHDMSSREPALPYQIREAEFNTIFRFRSATSSKDIDARATAMKTRLPQWIRDVLPSDDDSSKLPADPFYNMGVASQFCVILPGLAPNLEVMTMGAADSLSFVLDGLVPAVVNRMLTAVSPRGLPLARLRDLVLDLGGYGVSLYPHFAAIFHLPSLRSLHVVGMEEDEYDGLMPTIAVEYGSNSSAQYPLRTSGVQSLILDRYLIPRDVLEAIILSCKSLKKLVLKSGSVSSREHQELLENYITPHATSLEEFELDVGYWNNVGQDWRPAHLHDRLREFANLRALQVDASLCLSKVDGDVPTGLTHGRLPDSLETLRIVVGDSASSMIEWILPWTGPDEFWSHEVELILRQCGREGRLSKLRSIYLELPSRLMKHSFNKSIAALADSMGVALTVLTIKEQEWW